jgi:hypothetical protein
MTRRAAALAGIAALVLTGCGVSMPESGPVVDTTTTTTSRDDGSVNINPRRPGKGDSPEQIVRGFLDAMQATPAVKTSVAREFLTREARADWQPTGMIVYSTASIPRGSNEAKLSGGGRTDARGAWLGPLPDNELTIPFPMVLEGDEWRISDPPDELVVPQPWFEQRFRQVALYFFDPSGTILVPEPVFVPRGQQFASSLVNALLQGPSPELSATELTFLPRNLRSVVSVPVSASGVAEVDLTSDTAGDPMPTPPDAELLVSQLAWTLRQDPNIERFRVTIEGRPVQLPGGEAEFSVEHGQAYAPYVAGSSILLYGLRDGLMVGGSAQQLDPVPGPFGQDDHGLRTVTPDLRAEQVAGVSSTGSSLLLSSIKDTDEYPTTLIGNGEDLLDPAWDAYGRLWAVDRRSDGAVVQYLRGRKMRTVEVPGITGANVKDFLVSRDGSRLIAVVREDAENDGVVVSRIMNTGDGRVVGALPTRAITAPDDLGGRVRDIAWRTPTSLAVLHPIRRLGQVRSASVDGAPTGLDTFSVIIDDNVLALVGTPIPELSTYAFAKGVLVDLAGPRADAVEIDPGVTSLSYVG